MYRIHPTIDICTVTGRMNFYNPCLQNIPRDFEITIDRILNENCLQVEFSDINLAGSTSNELNDEESAYFLDKINENQISTVKSANSISLRNTFISRSGHVLLSADYCQLELSIITNLCRDETLIKIFNDESHDVFNLLASKWLNEPIEKIDDLKRQNVKKVIYGIIYGISPKTLSIFLGLSENDASMFIESFKCTFPGLKKFMNKQIETCRLKGYVETIRKRRRYLPNISSLDPRQRAQVKCKIIFSLNSSFTKVFTKRRNILYNLKAERQAINTIVQGSASDLVKGAMIKIEKTIRKKYLTLNETNSRGAVMVMQLHDELMYEVNKQDLNDIQSIVKDCMENCMELPVKMKIKMKIGSTWGSLTSVK